MEKSDDHQKQVKPRMEGEQAAALRDAKKISELSKHNDLKNPEVAIELYEKIVADPYYFESDSGKQFLRGLLRTAIHSEHYLSNDTTISGRSLSHEVAKEKEVHSKVKTEAKVPHRKASKEKRKKVKNKAYHIKKWSLLLLLVIMLAIFGSNLYEMIDYEIKSYQSEKKIEELISCILEPVDVVVSEENRIADLIASGIDPDSIDGSNTLIEEETGNQGGLGTHNVLHQYSKLFERNSDMAGWIRIDDTIINYPVMLTKQEEEYYLKRDFDKDSDMNGLPFMDARCDIVTPTTNFLIYGHNMKNGSMFSKLLKYEDAKFYEEHKSIVFDTIYEEGIYDIIAVFQTQVAFQGEEVFRYYEMIQAENENDFINYIKEVKNMSIYDIEATAMYGDQLLTLSTCDRRIENGRFVVVARKRS